MFRRLSDKEVRALTQKCDEERLLVVSHIGDGEYACNIFGNIYSSPWQALKAARKAYENNPDVTLSIFSLDSAEMFELLISSRTDNIIDSRWRVGAEAKLTFEKVNQPFRFGG
jgi:hypothetical protein